jgi:heme o synthase
VSAVAWRAAARTSRWGRVWSRLGLYFRLVKSLQTGLLLVTAAAGYVSGCCLNLSAGSLAALLGSLFLAVGGSTVLNMAWDCDIDARMRRTAARPLPSGQVGRREAAWLGGLLTAAGLVWAASLGGLYAGVVAAGVFFDVAIYTVWLKRRTPWSILVGGLAGGMPVLAGRALAAGRLDLTGGLLALGVLLWIPTHILTFSIKYREDYARAGVPTVPAMYGIPAARGLIAASTLLACAAFFAAGLRAGLGLPLLAGLGAAGLTLAGLAALGLICPRFNFVLYKGASIYMLACMLLLIAGGL